MLILHEQMAIIFGAEIEWKYVERRTKTAIQSDVHPGK